MSPCPPIEKEIHVAQYISDDKNRRLSAKVRGEGKKVSELAIEYSVSTKSIYTRLGDGLKGDNSVLEMRV